MSKPSTFGSITSRTTRSKLSSRSRFSASRPSSAPTTSYPSLRSGYESSFWTDCSSSTSSMRGAEACTFKIVGWPGDRLVIEPRVYRAAFVPALLVLVVAAFSLESRPPGLPQGLPADVLFDGNLAGAAPAQIADRPPDPRPGSAGDLAVAGEGEGHVTAP